MQFSISILLGLSLLFISLFLSLSLRSHFLSNKHKGKTLPLPPGSSGWPVVGETLDFLATGRKGHPEKFIFNRISKYSSYVFKTNLLGSPAVVLCGSASNKFLFSNENNLVQAWWPSSVDKIFPSTSPKTSSKQEAIILRKMLPNFLKPEALQNYIGIMDSIANRHFDSDWTNNNSNNNHHGHGNEVVVFPLTKRYTFWLACRLFISVEDPNHVAKFADPFGIMAAGILTVPINLPGTSFWRGIKAAEFIRKELSGIIKQRKVDLREGKASATQDILSHMLLTSDEDGKLMVEADIANKILGLLIGGHDTASSACASIVMYLAELPHVYQRVYEEQMEIAKSKAPGELLNWDDIKKMKYSWNVVCEAMRLAPPLQGAFREAMTDFMYNGFSIPKGWKIYWSASSTHKNPEFFPDPHKFDPSTFEGCGPAPYTYVPYGGGPRMCPGKEYARLEILVFVHNLVKRFKWEKLIPNEKFVFDPLPNPEMGLPIRLFPHKA